MTPLIYRVRRVTPDDFTAFGAEESTEWAWHLAKLSGATGFAIVWLDKHRGGALPDQWPALGGDLITWTVAAIYTRRRVARRAARRDVHVETCERRWLITCSAAATHPVVGIGTAASGLLSRFRCVNTVTTLGDLATAVPTPLAALPIAIRAG